MIPVSEQERREGRLLPDKAHAAVLALAKHGCLVLRAAFPAGFIDALHDEFLSRYGAFDLAAMRAEAAKPPPNPILEVGTARFEIAVRMTSGFGRPELLANPILMHLLGPLLGGADMRLSSFTAVASYPGAERQHIHCDHPRLFAEYGDLGGKLPMHAVNVSVPLIDVDMETGPTEIWPGTHRQNANAQAPASGSARFAFQRGDCILIDYRTLHAGLPNRGTRMRPILYLVYARSWFLDDANHSVRSPLDMPLAVYEALPPETRTLLLRAYSQAMRVALLADAQRRLR